MRLMCPNCQQAITVSEAEAGKTIACPLCAQSFPAPQLYTPPSFEQPLPPLAVPTLPPPQDEPAPPVPASTPEAISAAQSASAPISPELHGCTKIYSMPLSRRVCEVLVPASLTLIFLLTFFRWIGFYPAGYAAYTQNPWQAMFGDMSVDPVSDKVFGKETELKEGLRPAWWLIPYFILLVFGLFLAWAEPALRGMDLRLSKTAEHILRFRPAALAACVGLTLFLVLIQAAAGFGLENALRGRLPEELVEERKLAKTPEEFQKANMKIAVEEARWQMKSTLAMNLVIVMHLLALAGVIGETLLIHRGQEPPPRIGVLW
jgi:hypothetical protein